MKVVEMSREQRVTCTGQRRSCKHLAGINSMRLSVEEPLIGVVSLAWLAELNHADLEVIKRALDQAIVLLVVHQEVVPKWVLK